MRRSATVVLALASAAHAASCAPSCPNGFIRDPQNPGQCTTEGAPHPEDTENEADPGLNWVAAIQAVQAVEGRGVGGGSNQRLLIFGGQNNENYLGCMCPDYQTDSVLNASGMHGSRHAPDSIWNRHGAYGSDFSDTSACNALASNPPAVVVDDGTFVGYLTLNQHLRSAITAPEVVQWLTAVVCVDR